MLLSVCCLAPGSQAKMGKGQKATMGRTSSCRSGTALGGPDGPDGQRWWTAGRGDWAVLTWVQKNRQLLLARAALGCSGLLWLAVSFCPVSITLNSKHRASLCVVTHPHRCRDNRPTSCLSLLTVFLELPNHAKSTDTRDAAPAGWSCSCSWSWGAGGATRNKATTVYLEARQHQIPQCVACFQNTDAFKQQCLFYCSHAKAACPVPGLPRAVLLKLLSVPCSCN